MSGDNTKIVTAADAEVLIARVDLPLFKAFLRYREPFSVMVQAEVFDVPFGKAVLNFHEGHIQNIHIERRTYQHRGA